MSYNHLKRAILLIYLEANKKTSMIRFINLVICDKHVCCYSKCFLFSPGLNEKLT